MTGFDQNKNHFVIEPRFFKTHLIIYFIIRLKDKKHRKMEAAEDQFHKNVDDKRIEMWKTKRLMKKLETAKG